MADITTKSSLSEYSSELALACRTNPDGSMPFNKNFVLEFENADGSTELRTVIGGILGRLGTTNITSIAGATGEYLHFIELDKHDKVSIDLSGVGTPSAATVENIATALNAGLPCISVLWGFRDKTFLLNHGATTFVSRPSEILSSNSD